jgi:hypothetical protein
MHRPDPRRLLPIAAGICLVAASSAWAQLSPQDSIDRNLQQRAAQEREFHTRLESDVSPPPVPAGFSVSRNFFLLPSASQSLVLPDPRDLPGPNMQTPTRRSAVNSDVLLHDSQQRRQLELQTQTQAQPQIPGVPDPGRQQTQQIQQLGFEREQRAQDLQSNILRDSARAIGGKP